MNYYSDYLMTGYPKRKKRKEGEAEV